MDVAVTGAGSPVGTRVLGVLAESSVVDRVLALDSAEVAVPAGVTTRVVDVRDSSMGERLAGTDALVHLAVGDDPHASDAAMADRNVGGTRVAVEAAVTAGASRIVVVTAASVYGAHEDNDVPLSESSPRRPAVDAPGARHVGEVEAWLWERATSLPDGVTLTVLRPAALVGEGVDGPLQALVGLPRVPAVTGHRPPVQVLHLDDLVEAVVLALTTEMPGAYNVAAPGWVSLEEAAAIVHRRVLAVPEEVARAVADGLWRSGATGARSSRVDHLMHPCVLDVRRLEAAGWRARHSNRDTLAALAATEAPMLRVGGLRVRRERAAVAAVAAAGAWAGVVTLLARWLRR